MNAIEQMLVSWGDALKTLIATAVMTLLVSFSLAAQELPESPGSDIGYSSPDAALAALRAKPGVTERTQNDWIVLADGAENTFWSIAAEAHPAHPTAVKRSLVQRDGGVFLEMKVQCGASKEVCDHVVRQFQALNDALRQSMGQ